MLTAEETARRQRQRKEILALSKADRQLLKALVPKRKVRERMPRPHGPVFSWALAP